MSIPAFPQPYVSPPDGDKGMTLRDYFAAKVLQGMMNDADCFWEGAAPLAYQYADAMLEARK